MRYANQLPDPVEAMIISCKKNKPHWGANGLHGLARALYRFSKQYNGRENRLQDRVLALRLEQVRTGDPWFVRRFESVIFSRFHADVWRNIASYSP